MKTIFNDPLLHFLAIAGVLFIAYQILPGRALSQVAQSKTIEVSQARILALSAGFKKVWQRTPSEIELDGLVQGFVREEILYREALALGLDENDIVVRRRLRQKLEFLSEDLANPQADEAQLQAYLEAHADNYALPARFSFRQVYFKSGSGDKRERPVREKIKQLLAALDLHAANAELAGDSIMLADSFYLASEREVVRNLGELFLSGLKNSPVGQWHGPIRSGFGLHLVFVGDRVASRQSVLADVRDEVKRDWAAAARAESNAEYYEHLRSNYRVDIAELPSNPND